MRPNPRNNMMQVLVLLLPLALSGGVGAAEQSPVEEHDPLPFDPLSPDEQRLAVSTALEDGDVGALLSDRYIVVGAALYTHKAFQDLDVWPRMAEVWFYDQEDGQAVRSLVDLGLQEVVLVEEPAVEPPLTAVEVEQAGRLALADEWIRDRLAEAAIDPDQVDWTGRLWRHDEVCPEHRCVLVGLSQGSVFHHEHTIVVDVTDQQVRGILGHGPTVTYASEPTGVLP